ncbi:type II toxin-antitoxin system RelE/ParE family toxin [Caulobacter zeae]|uniref:type II toxin-antitoxin system RelE/ParE family toxin n=1 Tax=Caulobacter zeae TaxID=2055137 RepID=UPI001F0B9F5C|nr:type II toxin-antitoxin system RelE/ParE family toxin [Caulobacter zeae]
MAYRLSRRARDDLVDIYIEGVRAFGRQQAERYHAGLEEVFGLLEAFPRAAPERSEITPPVRIHPYKSHVIVYVVDGSDVRVLRIRHAQEDWSADPVG